MKLQLTLPVPTSLNKLYISEYKWNPVKRMRTPTGRRILSPEGVKSKNSIQAEARVQMKGQWWDYEWTKTNYIYLDTVIYFARKGTDDNNIYKLLCDALESICYDNDSRVLIRTQKIMYDTKNPRVEVTMKPVDYVGVFDSIGEASEFELNCKTCSRYLNGRCSILNDSLDFRVREELDANRKCSSYKQKKK